MTGRVHVGDIDRALAREFPHEWAEEWDRVGLAAGDPGRAVAGVLVTLDPTFDAVARAGHLGANVLVSHHPVALAAPPVIAPGGGPGGVLFAAMEARVALIAEHTNLDRSPAGCRALSDALGLAPLEPVERALQPMTRVTVYGPKGSATGIVDAMAAAGAGRVGAYERAAFVGSGEGEFTPRAEAVPAVGSPGSPESVDEVRVEMLCGRSRAAAVVAAARSAHTYEEPVIVTEDVAIARNSARLGMRCASDIPLTVRALAERAVARLGRAPRVWSADPDAPAQSIVTATGSAGSVLDDAACIGADTLICGEVRYHDALDAVARGLSIVELGHDMSEWPLVEVLARAVRAVPGLDPTNVFLDPASPAWWTPDGR